MEKERKYDCHLIIFTAVITFLFTFIAVTYTSSDQMALEVLATIGTISITIFYFLCRSKQ